MFSPGQIRDLIDGRPIVDGFAYGKSDEAAVDALHRNVCRAIERQTSTLSRIVWDDYGSGYASFVDAWFYREESGWAGPAISGAQSWQGLAVLLSRLSPYFVFLEGHKSWDERGGSSYMPSFGDIDRLSSPAVAALAGQVQAVLEQHGLIRLHATDLSAPLDPSIRVPSLFSAPGTYLEYDALFYWED
ncbi:hypothetical protein MUN74_09025 [Agromyces endophyticus]|uniref:hypothetical protein n=1 Tax=Agromyces sp. H17E-10 TaxID=2932244 RepID=UPI001FCFEC38|nr:hypothetical protein [Agromyces sp. H17E-10]UOQ91013.1 hypothetical protein MUN74_09025 [Agromyces sp. H17E-10]